MLRQFFIILLVLNHSALMSSMQWNNGIAKFQATPTRGCYIRMINTFVEIWCHEGDRYWKTILKGSSAPIFCNLSNEQAKEEFYKQEKRHKTRYISKDLLKKILRG